MTHSSAYNASKGAAHILTLQMARELKKRHNITVFGVSPNKMHSTQMTNYINNRVCELRGWTPEQAAEYQKASLPAGEETDPVACAEFIAFLLSTTHRHKYLNGCIIPYGA
jgi:NAD(P)-dependent dehydrogenase (short-subunit alcohol dehydrogenase family)